MRQGLPDTEPRRSIELRIISAQDLKDVKLIGRMKTYAVAYVDPEHKVRTRVDEKGGVNPVWNDLLTVSVAEGRLKGTLTCLNVEIFSQSHIRHDKLVGTVRILLSDVLKGGEKRNPIHCLAYWVRLPSGDPHGILNVWIPPTGKFLRYKISELRKEDQDVDENVETDLSSKDVLSL